MTCKDCLYFKACKMMLEAACGHSISEDYDGDASQCKTFEEKIDVDRIRAEAIKEFAKRLKRYYTTLKGKTSAFLVAYHIAQIEKEFLQKKE